MTSLAPDRPFLGILLMILFCCMAPLADSIVKILGAAIPLGMVLVIRFGAQPVILGAVGLATGIRFYMSRRALWLTVLRTLLHITGIGAVYMSLRYLPLADATAIAFVMPFFMLLLGYLVLNEEVGRFRLSACVVGFSGTLLVIQPNFVEVGWAALWPLVVAVNFAVFMLVTRAMAKEVEPIAMQTVSGVMALAILGPIMLLGPDWPALAWVEPTRGQVWLLLAMGTLGTTAHLVMTWALRYAPSATLAPIQYLEIPIAALLGWVIFADLPNGLAALGICITMSAGLAIVFRERALERRRPLPTQP